MFRDVVDHLVAVFDPRVSLERASHHPLSVPDGNPLAAEYVVQD
jgi:hypothetical protein